MSRPRNRSRTRRTLGRFTPRARAVSSRSTGVVTARSPRPLRFLTRPLPRLVHLSVTIKFALASLLSLAWLALSLWLALPWMDDLAELTNWPVSLLVVGGIALVPGLMNSFLAASLLLDRRPERRALDHYPPVSILIAAFNEGESIRETLKSLADQQYPGDFEALVIDDGSTDATARICASLDYPWLRLLRQEGNDGKSAALNRGLAESRFGLVVTLDADSYLHADALRNLVERFLSDPPGTRAVAGAMLVRNSRTNWITQAQEWEYFGGIAAIKRMQSFFHGTLVAQGAFSIYDRVALEEAGGWPDCIGEDIVLTWGMLRRGWRIGHAEDAICFTNAPDSLAAFAQQRRRWARGMIEAFRANPGILLVPRLSTFFIYWNLLFPWLDVAYTFAFMPGLVLALFFGIYWIVGPMTLALLPMALLMNFLMYRINVRMFVAQDLQVRRNLLGLALYAFGYSLILQPASVAGYVAELLGLRKTWGRKVAPAALAAILLFFPFIGVPAAHAQTALPAEISMTSDAEDFEALRLRSGALLRYDSPFRYLGVAAQITRYAEPGSQQEAPALLVLWRDQDQSTLAGTVAELGLVRVAGRTRVIGDATWAIRPAERTGVEFIVASDLVETAAALDRATTYTFAAVSAERELSDRLTVIGLAGHQWFTDGNTRLHARGSLIWMLVPKHGLRAEVRYRQFESDRLDVDGAYFNPERYREIQAGLAIRKRFANWLVSGRVAAGRENLGHGVRNPTAHLELRATRTSAGGVRFVVQASHDRSAGFGAGDDYWYRVVGASVIVPF